MVTPGMRLHLSIAIFACVAVSANAAPLNDALSSVALIPVDGELNEDQRRLLDAALRAELEALSNQVLGEDERLTHVRGARSLGLGCQVEASPACLTFVADVAGLSDIYVGSAENRKIRLARYAFADGEITQRFFAEADVPKPGASYVRVAQTLLGTLQEKPAREESPPPTVAAQDAPEAKPAENLAVADEAELSPADGDKVLKALPAIDFAALGPTELSVPVGVSGAALLILGGTSWGLSQWVARTPLTSPVSGSKSVADRLQLIDATESFGLVLMVSGALVSSVGGGLALWPETTPE